MGLKNTLLAEYALEDIKRNRCVIVFDPDGQPTDTILGHYPRDRRDDIIIFDPSNYHFPVPFNPLSQVPTEKLDQTLELQLDAFKAAYKYEDIAAPDWTNAMGVALASLLVFPGGSLLGAKYLLTSEAYAERVRKHVTEAFVKHLWGDFYTLPPKDRIASMKSARTNLSTLFIDSRMRHSLGQSDTAFTMSDVLKNKRVLLIRLPVSELGKTK